MGLPYHPKAAEIFLCEFPRRDVVCLGDEAMPGEMDKTRMVVVVSKRLKGRNNVANVIPISKTPPRILYPWHMQIPTSCLPPLVVDASMQPRYAKCDMICTVSIDRLNYYRGHWNTEDQIRGAGLSRRDIRQKGKLDAESFRLLKLCVAAATGITADIFETPAEIRSHGLG